MRSSITIKYWQTKAWRRSLDIPQQDGCEGHLRSVRWELQSRFRDAELSNAAQTFIDPKSLAIGSIDFLDFFELAAQQVVPVYMYGHRLLSVTYMYCFVTLHVHTCGVPVL